MLSKSQRGRFYKLQILVVIMAFAEIIGVASIIPFMALVADTRILQENVLLSDIYQLSGVSSEYQFIFFVGLCLLLVLFLASLVSMFTVWRLSMFANKIGSEIADRLYTHYLKQDWLFHATETSANLTKKISVETLRLTNGVLMPLMHMNARIVFAMFMIIAIFLYDPLVAIISLIVISGSYFILYKYVKKRMQKNGETISQVNEQRFRLMNEGFGGIKDILLLGRDNDFINRFNITGQKLAYSSGMNVVFQLAPRYFMELIAFGSMITIVLYLISSHSGNFLLILPILSVYALAGFKLLPAFQQIYVSSAQIKGNIAAFDSIHKDLKNSSQKNFEHQNSIDKNFLVPTKQISLENITFRYPNKSQSALDQLNINVPKNSIIGIVGASGAGKSTLIDILLGLISPQKGNLKIDETFVTKDNLRQWQNAIGFVPQHIFLSEGSIAENVAFGIAKNKININQVKQALKLSYLNDLIDSLENGIDTNIGERGVQLSGGQRQRIGIARALYSNAEVLIFDEATSSLDGITEKMIMEAIHNLSGEKTIILIAHRLKTIQKCDQIFFIENGTVIDQGTYDELIQKNEYFKKMAAHS